MAQHTFSLTADWIGGRNGEGNIEVGNLKSTISAPLQLDGPGVGTNPEEMLVGAAATCYMITLAAVLEKRQLSIVALSMKTEGIVSTDNGTRFEKIIHKPEIVLAFGASDKQIETAKTAVLRAEKACMISKAIAGNVDVSAIPNVSVAAQG